MPQSAPVMNTIGLFFVLSLMPFAASGCSMLACLGDGTQMQSDFVVVVKYNGKPLPGASVIVTPDSGDNASAISAVTSSRGVVHISRLQPGGYWIEASFLGIGAGSECFHVEAATNRKARRSIRYEWGDFAVGVSKAAGVLLDSQPGPDKTPLGRLIHRVTAPMVGAQLTLHSPLTGQVFSTISDEKGEFAFNLAPPGTWVLHVQTADASWFNTGDFLISIGPHARGNSLIFTRTGAGGGSCGGIGMELKK
jgi:carboxypeptidase family protein